MKRIEYKTKTGFGYIEVPDDVKVTKAPGLTVNEDDDADMESLDPPDYVGTFERPTLDENDEILIPPSL